MTNPCRSCPLHDADKNNATCMACAKRVAHVRRLAADLPFACNPTSSREILPRVALLSRQAQFLAFSPELSYE